jgi:hypothetical protein
MRLTSIRPGDIVLVDDGIPYHALVVDKERGRLRVRPLGRTLAPRTVKAAWVAAHWRASTRAQRSDRASSRSPAGIA